MCFVWNAVGGQGRNRTADASLFRAALYQLSYLAASFDGSTIPQRTSSRDLSVGVRRRCATDSSACRESARQWRKEHPAYWDQYRESHPASVVRNRTQQQTRDTKRRLPHLANNTLASELKRYPGTVWLVGSGLCDLANNTLAPTQLLIFQTLPRQPRAAAALANNTALAS